MPKEVLAVSGKEAGEAASDGGLEGLEGAGGLAAQVAL